MKNRCILTKPPECVDIITDSCFQGTSWENGVMFGGLYQHTRVDLYSLYTQPEISFNYCMTA